MALWFVALGVASVAMVVALVQFTLALIASPRLPGRQSSPMAQVRASLLALNSPHRTFQLTQLSETELRLEWDGLTGTKRTEAIKVSNPFSYHVRLLLFEPTAEVRCFESVRTTGKVGGRGANAQWQFGAVEAAYSGQAEYVTHDGIHHRVAVSLDTAEIKGLIEDAARNNGWTFRSVVLSLQASARGAQFFERLTPAVMRRMGARRFWGTVYVLLWFSIVGLLLLWMPRSLESFLGLATVVAFFVVVQVFVVWIWRQSPRQTSEVE